MKITKETEDMLLAKNIICFNFTQEELLIYLLKNHNLFVYVEPDFRFKDWCHTEFVLWEEKSGSMGYHYSTYEEALEEGLQKLIIRIKKDEKE